jgi:20S proteasome alpha/beta subunit
MITSNDDLFNPNCYDTNIQDKVYGREDDISMSISVALIGKDGIVLATDSRVCSITAGFGAQSHDDNCPKLWNIGNIGISVAGNLGGYEGILIEDFKKHINNSSKLEYDKFVDDFVTFVKDKHEILMKQWGASLLKSGGGITSLLSFFFDFIIVGYDDKTPTIKHAALSQGIFLTKYPECELRNYYTTGIWDIANYWMIRTRNYLPTMGINELKLLASYLVYESRYYNSVGGHIQMLTIQKDIGLKIIPQSEVAILGKQTEKLINKNTKNLISSLNS